MDPLKVFAMLETTLSVDDLSRQFRSAGWHTHVNTDALQANYHENSIRLESSGDQTWLLRGELAFHSDPLLAATPLLNALQLDAIEYQLDVFEEDGRLLRRWQQGM